MSINISEVIWTVICFFALFFVLKKLLFDPMIRFLDQRQARLDAAEEESKQAQSELAAARQAAEESFEHCAQEDRALVKRHRAEQEQARIEALGQARQDAAQLLEDARAKISREEAEADAATDESLDELAQLLLDRLSGLDDSAAGAREREQV